MEIQPHTFTPQHPLLKKHVSYFYFLKTDSPTFETQYYAFPSTNTVLNIHRQVACDIQRYYTRVYEDPSNPYLAILQGMRELPLRAHLQGRLDKVTIIFSPLGLNQFLGVPFLQVGPKDSQIFTAWNHLPHYHAFLQNFYATQDNHTRAQLLEDFLLSLYTPLPEQELLEKTLALLADFELERSIEEISRHVGVTTRTLHRTFKKHVGISPVGYRKIARFRHSLHNKLVVSHFKKLTEVGYASNFYDQAYFNKIYKQLTGSNPTAFFNAIAPLANDRLIFQFLKDEAV
ncbi:helix-turn-helix domain-containing protein [Rufibacter psychrotolerans]|uniref:helix-turn-helix domain-containing protein n=1 Tax=Rufibacter psychrotolerans TaxID=2812556 RepID=UPI00196899E7|nr:helix-turn-helix transcriptional regulator [Rufibacter sp. SYSU D00308]